MKTISRRVRTFMEDQMGVFVTAAGVEVCINGSSSVCAASGWPGENSDDAVYIAIAYEGEEMDEFIEAFNITAVNQISAITPTQLLGLYQRGLAEIYSVIDDGEAYFALYFRKENGMLMVKEEEDGAMQQAIELLETPEEFRTYTRHRFMMG